MNKITSTNSTKELVQDVISDQFCVDPETLHDNITLDDLDADSLDGIELIIEFEREFNIHIPDREIPKLIDSTLNEIDEFIQTAINCNKRTMKRFKLESVPQMTNDQIDEVYVKRCREIKDRNDATREEFKSFAIKHCGLQNHKNADKAFAFADMHNDDFEDKLQTLEELAEIMS